MEEPLVRHLDAIAMRMGRFLHRFDDPGFHTGSAAGFVAEFRRILELAMLRQPGEQHPISYATAAAACRVPSPAAAGAEPPDPVSTLIQGLEAPALRSPDMRRLLPLGGLREDLTALLRAPALRFYVAVSDRPAFFSQLDEVAKKGGFPLVKEAGRTSEGKVQCPFCHSLFQFEGHDRLSQCGACRRPLESVRSVSMVSAVVTTISYELLRKIVSMNLVESFQAEGKIVPLRNGS